MAQSDFEQESTANATWSRMPQGNRRFAEGKARPPMAGQGDPPDAA